MYVKVRSIGQVTGYNSAVSTGPTTVQAKVDLQSLTCVGIKSLGLLHDTYICLSLIHI